MRSTMTKHKHLILSNRNDIQAIGQLILKDSTTVSKEGKRNRQVRESTYDNPSCPLLDKTPFICNRFPTSNLSKKNIPHQTIQNRL